MKWWGWGQEGVAFSHEDKPDMGPFVFKHIGLDLDSKPSSFVSFDDLPIAGSNIPDTLKKALVNAVGDEHVTTDAKMRVIHTYGKSLRDLVRIRRGELGRLPDVVVFPGDESEVAAIVTAALDNEAVLIPFGGGTNISGSLEPPAGETRPVISVDLARMNEVIEVDEPAQLARIQAGALGPDLEEQLKRRGWTLGHFPDSFTHSTIGGWVATRSSGMQSDKYGDIADITRAVRVVTPSGVLATRAVPSTSTGPSVREMILGSEGRLGIITEVTVQVHRIPEERKILAYLFPTWHKGIEAMREIAASDFAPSVTRVSDSRETQFSFATKKGASKVDALKSKAMKTFLEKRKSFDVSQMCLSFIGYEGSKGHVQRQRKGVGAIVARHGGICIGSGPGTLYDQKKFDTPYIRDFLLDRGGLADVSETSASWSTLENLYNGVVERANKVFDDLGVRGWIMCHLSHSYHSGACLYFTFAFKQKEDVEELAQYDRVKEAIQQGFIDFGGTLSHHHAVGKEHARWLADDISEPGVVMLNALFDGIDPNKNFNYDKITGA